MKVTLLKAVGDHPEGTELEINDNTVIEAWEKLGVIKPAKPTKEK
ncbi:hypothetical protein [Chryseobacterium mucoviscidosis]